MLGVTLLVLESVWVRDGVSEPVRDPDTDGDPEFEEESERVCEIVVAGLGVVEPLGEPVEDGVEN